ncbi:hypothetical protein V1L54_07750 [Streptomyces sp. TRM 70361]|uniref:hypothetical protein n=1 Tax=Streptomyces sp. TRM 70361 TaxID=3116553 RepID=UPI002E7BB382|nr:hypothetical protein [Streptomyces sp. TRM 70361]MEE1939308.1 hypothetical protein [Streptomyces sp. TRM 70361]
MSPTTFLALSPAAGLVDLAKEFDETKVTPGILGFLVFAVLGVAVWMLLKSMTRHIGKVDFEERPAGDAERP